MKIIFDDNNPHDSKNRIGSDPICSSHSSRLGTIVDGGHFMDLAQDAFINQDGTPPECYYMAYAYSRSKTDDDGDPIVYKVRWEIENHETEDESEACDWDKFTVEEL